MNIDPRLTGGDGLDPADWADSAAAAHRMVDYAVTRLREAGDRPVWQPMPERVRAAYDAPLPHGPQPLSGILDEMQRNLFPYAMGNIHPRFWGWYMGSGDFTGALGDFLAAIDGSNLGGGDTAASLVDQQVTRWIVEMTGFPAGASAALVSGGSMANIVGLTAARNAMAGVDLHHESVADIPAPLRFYASDQVHSCHMKAMNLLGLGSKALRKVASDGALRMDVEALRAVIAEDRAKGLRPACVIATAGTTNTGAIDPLPAIADLCREEGLWLHIDGCIGALIALAPGHRHMIAGMERADSLALDLHKWLHAPFDVGCAVLRDRELHRSTFAEHAEYLTQAKRGLSAGEFLFDYTLETTRGFRALKVWMMLKHHGADAFGRLIDRNIEQARHLAALVRASGKLELMAPVETSIVCFRHNPGGMDEDSLRAHNTEILLRLQENGIAVPSDTTIRGRYCLRVAICNHRTRNEDLDLLVSEVLRIGDEVASA
ncbi:pyridoxal phosphate-dependent decarboxylase family protein [Aestuariivirga sp.]|uniref:pyridoxal phosphate-dependent decarboxylase family protein n=1 Tax=Aestuariivirga sp. TaxID=2650926 RepID=UPI00391A5E94